LVGAAGDDVAAAAVDNGDKFDDVVAIAVDTDIGVVVVAGGTMVDNKNCYCS